MEVELRDVHRSYQIGSERTQALAGVTFSISGSEFVSVVGPSGAGKSTLLHLLGGLDSATGGSVRVNGLDLATLGDDGLAAYRLMRVGLVFQSFNLLARLTAEENVAVPCLLAGRRPTAARRRAAEVLGLVGLTGLEARKPGELSGGQMQRVAIARALVMEPQLILADEPTGHLDSATGEEIVSLLHAAAGRGHMVVMVTHNARAAQRSDRVIGLTDGRVTADGPVSQLHLETAAVARPLEGE